MIDEHPQDRPHTIRCLWSCHSHLRTRTYIHTPTHTFIHTHTPSRIRSNTQPFTTPNMHSTPPKLSCSLNHYHTLTHKPPLTCTYSRTLTHTRPLTCTNHTHCSATLCTYRATYRTAPLDSTCQYLFLSCAWRIYHTRAATCRPTNPAAALPS